MISKPVASSWSSSAPANRTHPGHGERWWNIRHCTVKEDRTRPLHGLDLQDTPKEHVLCVKLCSQEPAVIASCRGLAHSPGPHPCFLRALWSPVPERLGLFWTSQITFSLQAPGLLLPFFTFDPPTAQPHSRTHQTLVPTRLSYPPNPRTHWTQDQGRTFMPTTYPPNSQNHQTLVPTGPWYSQCTHHTRVCSLRV